jgi:hypothetical protein
MMKNVQITLDEKLLAEVDRVCAPLGLNRSQAVRQALRDWLRRHAIERFARARFPFFRPFPKLALSRSLARRPDYHARGQLQSDPCSWSERRLMKR